MRSSLILSAFVVASSLALGGCQTTAGEKKKAETVVRTQTQGAAVQTAQAAPPVAQGSNFAAAVAALAGAPGTGVMPAAATASAYAAGAAQPRPPVYVQPQASLPAMAAPLPAHPTAPVHAQTMQAPPLLPQPTLQQIQSAPDSASTPIAVAEPVRIRRF